jgi:hypothetical protein
MRINKKHISPDKIRTKYQDDSEYVQINFVNVGKFLWITLGVLAGVATFVLIVIGLWQTSGDSQRTVQHNDAVCDKIANGAPHYVYGQYGSYSCELIKNKDTYQL